ncbi:hypothetical protein ACH5RR_031044 [Cinchona calisaya]|uniref:Uncharacterized protein n=1 Tax=Cinchona calisaya TaxID=153742 RepID=A0ABD2YE29_9GENT
MGRAPCCEKVGLKRGRWTSEEDEILINYIKLNGEGSWRSLPKNAGLLRCGKSCRLRWINYLRTDLKRGNFSREEEETIIKLHTSVGNKWSLIASNLPGRTDNEVKNYWNSHLSRKIYSFRSTNMVTTSDTVKMAGTCKRKGGRVSRAVAKKYNMKKTTISKTTTNTTTSSSSSTTKPKIGEISETQEDTAAENAKVHDNGVGSGEESGKNHLKQVEIHGEVVERVSINSTPDFSCDDLERFPETEILVMPYPQKLEGQNEVVVEPNKEELDDATTLLFEQFLESELIDFREISVHDGDRENECMDPESALINKETDWDGGISYLNSDTSADLYECFSPLNSCFNHDLVTWDTEYAIPGFGLWDDQGDDILWL